MCFYCWLYFIILTLGDEQTAFPSQCKSGVNLRPWPSSSLFFWVWTQPGRWPRRALHAQERDRPWCNAISCNSLPESQNRSLDWPLTPKMVSHLISQTDQLHLKVIYYQRSEVTVHSAPLRFCERKRMWMDCMGVKANPIVFLFPKSQPGLASEDTFFSWLLFLSALWKPLLHHPSKHSR